MLFFSGKDYEKTTYILGISNFSTLFQANPCVATIIIAEPT